MKAFQAGGWWQQDEGTCFEQPCRTLSSGGKGQAVPRDSGIRLGPGGNEELQKVSEGEQVMMGSGLEIN